MTAVLLLGQLTRERHGFLNIGGEGAVIVGLYVVTLGLVAFD